MSRALDLIRQWDADVDIAGEITLKANEWPVQRHALLTEVRAAARLYDALKAAEKLLGHYTYSRENRETLAAIRSALAEYAGESTQRGEINRG